MSDNLEKKPIYKKWWFWVVAVVVLGSVGSVMQASKNSADPAVSDSPSVTVSDSSSVTSEPPVVSDVATSGDVETSAPLESDSVSSSETSEIATEPFILDISGFDVANCGELDTGNLKLNTGDLLSVIYSEGDVIVVKAKIQSLLSNKQTINQNYYNVGDLIKKHGFGACQELQYWAVADMSNGEEEKVISFTLDKATIEGVLNGSILENQLGDYVSDLFVHRSLSD
ncbi:MAG: hypothetical protein NC203_10035 [Firmicutes bacterium]|nr:hypothetical protein [Bacillota bacterium]